jgi:oxalate decarboxylase/phosphoglucose isomerase-like protein (cupin superfamily)
MDSHQVNRSKFTIQPYLRRVGKPWGYELIFVPPDSPVMGKILHINKGARFSLQYHDQKEEILCLLKGEAKITIEDEEGNLQELPMEPKKGYRIRPFQKHRVAGVTDCDILEASTPEKGNTYRLEDDYGRGTETEEERKKFEIRSPKSRKGRCPNGTYVRNKS